MGKRITNLAMLALIDDEVSEKRFVETEGCFYVAVPRSQKASNAIDGPADSQTPISWQPAGVIAIDGNGSSVAVSGEFLSPPDAVLDGTVRRGFGRKSSKVLAAASAVWDFGNPSSCRRAAVSGQDPTCNNSTWTKTAITTAIALGPTGQPDATAITEVGAASRLLYFTGTNTVGPGWTRIKFSYKPGACYLSWKYFVDSHLTDGRINFLQLPTIAALENPSPANDPSYTVYQTADPGYHDGFSFTPRNDGWIDVVWETHLDGSGTFGANLGSLNNRGSTAEAVPGVALTLGPITYEQERVSFAAPTIGLAQYALTQTTFLKQPVLRPDGWTDDGSYLVESVDADCELTGRFDAGAAWTLSVVATTRQNYPAAIATLFELYGTTASAKVRIGTDGQWQLSHTNNAGTTITADTGVFVAPVPVAITLTDASGVLSLYIDGALAGTLAHSGTTTLTSLRLFGSDTRAMVRHIATWMASALTGADLAAAVIDQRAAAALPALWPVDILAGQSNANSQGGNTATLNHSGVFSWPGTACSCWDSEAGHGDAWQPGILCDSVVTGSWAGPRVGVQNEARRLLEPMLLINAARGGSGIVQWLLSESGYLYTYLHDQVTQSLASLGTSLYTIRCLHWIQGESESGDTEEVAALYAARLLTLISESRASWGTGLRVAIHRLDEWVGNGSQPGIYLRADTIRAAEDAAAAADPLVAISRWDGNTDHNIHYGDRNPLGRNLYRAATQRSPIIEVPYDEIPQRGTWGGSGVYFDAENGITLSGADITSIVSLEGSKTWTSGATKTQIAYDWSGGRRCIKFSAAAYLVNSAGDWSAFSGDGTPFVACLQMTTGATPANHLVTIGGSGGGNRILNLVHSSAVNLTAQQYDGIHLLGVVKTIAAATRYTIVVYCDGTSLVMISATGVHAALSAPTGIAAIDPLTISYGIINGTGGGDGSVWLLRRFGIKPATAGTAQAIATDLYTRLNALG